MTQATDANFQQSHYQRLKFHSTLKEPVEYLCKGSFTSKVLQNVLKEGELNVARGPLGRGKAAWFESNRVILLSDSVGTDLFEQVDLLARELLNAQSSEAIRKLKQLAASGKISKEEFVEQIERLEHQNSLAWQDALSHKTEKFPFKVPTWKRFSEDFLIHYKFQQLTGHAQAIANNYDKLCTEGSKSPYQGSWKVLPSEDEKPVVRDLFFHRVQLETGCENALKNAHAYVQKMKDENSGCLKYLSEIFSADQLKLFEAPIRD
jgi:hypothetical protein